MHDLAEYSPLPRHVEARVEPSAALVGWVNDRGAFRTLEFLTASICNPHTRRAYHRAASRFAAWCCRHHLLLGAGRTPHVGAYIEELARGEQITADAPPAAALAPLSVKQHLAALKHWMDLLVTSHVLDVNPAHAVRAPRYSQTTGKTPALERETTPAGCSMPDAGTVTGARDRALIAIMLFSFARIGAVVAMKVQHHRGAGTTSATFTLHEKGGKFHRCRRTTSASYLDAYIALAGLHETPDAPLWKAPPATGKRSPAKRSPSAAHSTS
jgi:site-specific recombinase XerC